MDIIAQWKDKDIASVIDPTVTAFAPLLKAKKAFIKEVPFKTFQYGSLDRHQLDIYYPLSPPPTGSKTPILFFIYGGGLNTGDRRISPKTFGLVYSCVAAYFVRRGYLVIIPDYRLVPNVTYPGPAEDVRDAIRWVIQNLDVQKGNENPDSSPGSLIPDLNNIFLMGHSAGALHIATMMFEQNVLPWDDDIRQRVKGLILQGPPYDLSQMTTEWSTWAIHAQYWGNLEIMKANDPINLYRRLPGDVVDKLPGLLMVQGENEPDWLAYAGDRFHEAVKERTGISLDRIIAKGHNHISVNWALSTGVGEDWAEETLAWLAKVQKP
ncbi:alpha/beta hydrolase domain-containing protein [Agrocybe pediades]|nr:alpha/beta hydrolase domain-containing protein [Agrocybe pediades]